MPRITRYKSNLSHRIPANGESNIREAVRDRSGGHERGGGFNGSVLMGTDGPSDGLVGTPRANNQHTHTDAGRSGNGERLAAASRYAATLPAPRFANLQIYGDFFTATGPR